jgi:hypothetical protein
MVYMYLKIGTAESFDKGARLFEPPEFFDGYSVLSV